MNLDASCRRLFEHHRRETFGGLFHVASLEAGGSLCSWASAHHALALRHLEPDLARVELETLYRANRLESGLVSRERVVDAEALANEPLAVLLGEDGRSRLIEPPMAAYSAARVATQIGDAARGLLASATGELDAIWSERLPLDTSLPVILHPLESATPGTPLYDAIVDTDDIEEWTDDLASIGRSAAACQFDPTRALRAGHPFVVEDPIFCGWFLLALEEVAAAWGRLGDAPHEKKLRIRAEMIAEGIADRLWWEEELIYAGYDRGRDEPLRALTAGGIVPAASRSLLEDGAAKRAVDRHLRPSASALWAARGISFNPVVSERVASQEEIPWRGNVAAAETHFWAHLALARAQRVPDARVARLQLEERVEQHGFREVYDPLTGEGRGAGAESGVTLPSIALEMRASEPG
jgi:hypothetical protein